MKLLLLSALGLVFAAPLTAGDLETSYDNLKQAVQQKNPVTVKQLAAATCALARQTIAAPVPEGEAAKEAWPKYVAYAREVELFTEYALYSTAIQSDPPTLIDLISTLEKQNPKSKYLGQAYANYFLALQQTGAGGKIVPIAEKAVVSQPDNEDLLLVLSDTAMNARQSDRAGAYAERLIAALARRPKPESLSAADWERKRTAALGHGYYIAGMVHSEKAQFFQANEDLRAALPLIKGNDAMLAATLFHLGVANYQLGKASMNRAQVMEGAKFSEQAAAMKSPFAQAAWSNAHRMKDEALRMR